MNTTRKNLVNNGWENDWQYLPVIKALVAISALLHDWGKSTKLFQDKLKKGSSNGDPLRHEWISCLLLNALVQQGSKTDEGWLQLLSSGNLDEQALKSTVINKNAKPLMDLPLIAQLVGWLILTHHRLPYLYEPENEADQKRETLTRMLKSITPTWGYQNKNDDPKRLDACFEFPEGLLSQSSGWTKQLKKWSARLLNTQEQISQLIESGAYRVVLHHARLCLMLGDHYYSSCQADDYWQTTVKLYANTGNHKELKQKLDEHLVKVSEHALKISQTLSRFSSEMDLAYDIKNLKTKSPAGYEWQDKAVEVITKFKTQHDQFKDQGYGWFVVNMASTGCGKTIANAKIMRALSNDGDSLRYILALGLRTLTLQTGDEYREKIGLQNDELAVLIGSSAIKELHDKSKRQQNEEPSFEELGSESLENLLEEELDYDNAPTAEFLDVLFPKHKPKQAEQHKAFLYKPVIACTIDHIIAATETLRGGKYILPCLRLLSSDLVIDEVDDFDGEDLVAIGRLIHLAGMLGRKVMISSATIPPALAEGFFNAYQEGWRLHCQFRQAHPMIACAWIDEFSGHVERLDNADSISRCSQYQAFHRQFIAKRVANLQKQPVKRKAFIVRCAELLTESCVETKQQRYFELIKQTVSQLHQHHHTIDQKTGKKVSFGVIRMANIPPCVALTQHLLAAEWNETVAPRIMAYHSRQVLLLRHIQEKHLDAVLKRKEKPGEMPAAFDNQAIRMHLDSTAADDVIFILVVTPVEEVGRDHDFDWAIIEPSSYRSIIQLAGRIRRHRQDGIEQANIGIMQYNLRALRKGVEVAYYRPGYENKKSLKLKTHDLTQLVDEASLKNTVNAIPRIQQADPLNPKQQLADLEHQAMLNILVQYQAEGPQGLQAWLQESWWLTALPQQLNRFRESRPEITLYRVWQDSDAVFHEKDERGQFIPRQSMLNISVAEPMPEHIRAKLWLDRSYEQALRQHKQTESPDSEFTEDELMTINSKRYGEITLPENDDRKWFYSDQLGLFLALT